MSHRDESVPGPVLHIQDYEEIEARLGGASGADVAQVVHWYRAHRRGPDGRTTEFTIEVLRAAVGFTVQARADDGRRVVTPGAPTWDLAAAIENADWSGLDR